MIELLIVIALYLALSDNVNSRSAEAFETEIERDKKRSSPMNEKLTKNKQKTITYLD